YTLHRQGVIPEICTSTGPTDADSVIERLRDGQLTLPPALQSWRTTAPDDESALTRLRETCPWKAHDAELDLQV
ncbi:hypothetical protein ACSTLO_00250, partial [Vibrio parahaemolyticus]